MDNYLNLAPECDIFFQAYNVTSSILKPYIEARYKPCSQIIDIGRVDVSTVYTHTSETEIFMNTKFYGFANFLFKK